MYAPGPGVAEAMVSVISKAGWWKPNYGTTAGSGGYESADAAFYTSVVLDTQHVVRRVWWVNGATVSASYNVDCGVYADDGGKPGARLVSCGSTAQGTALEVQFADVSDTVLPAGRYWLALAASSTAATFFRFQQSSAGLDAMSRMSQVSALPLPATATPTEAASSNIYLCGFATTPSP